jgi:hypothetical protein
MMLREREKFGDVELSIVADEFAYCHPRVNMPTIDAYEMVEVALLMPRGFVSPKRIGLPDELDELWSTEEVAGYVPVEYFDLLRSALKDRQKGKKPDEIRALFLGRVEMMEAGKR